ncbi:MAG: hypothetical protein IPL61_02190 [Myxococcales bacterium]|nr:hypothetical protein [Myxococcales bacterium]
MRVLLMSMAVTLCACGGGGAKIVDASPGVDAGPVDAGTIDTPVDPPDAGLDAAIGHPGTGTVTGAVRAASPNYSLYGTLRSGDGSSASPSYQRRGGITGATQP